MRFYTKQHKYYCGIDLHTKTMYACIVDNKNNIIAGKNMRCSPIALQTFLKKYKKDIIVGAECIFSWYWLADYCASIGVPFILGHALYMRAIYGGKAKNDKIDAQKIAFLLKGGNFPLAYTYPMEMRKVRDLLRRRNKLVQDKSEYLAHIQLTNYQYNLSPVSVKSDRKCNTKEVVDHFQDSVVKENVKTDLEMSLLLKTKIEQLERHIMKIAKGRHLRELSTLKTIPGCGRVLSLVFLYEIQDISRFPSVQQFCSYARLVKSKKESAGKIYGTQGGKIGNAHLKWAFSELTYLFIRELEQAKKFVERKSKKYGKSKALAILSHRLGRAMFFMLKRKKVFDVKVFF